ncbi:MAG: hypothetical protein EPO10_20735 [Reyranella sp.]|nr:MAG: hypothetical protein EPO10_20735 [Reyranella sp.]
MNTPRGVWLDDLTRQEAISRFDGNTVVVIPVASGGPDLPHLPLKTATVIARALGQKLLERLAIVMAAVVDADSIRQRNMLGQILAARLDGLRSLGARRLAILDVGPSHDTPFDIAGDVLFLRACDRSDPDEYITSCMMALDPRSVRMSLLPAGSRSDAFGGERGMSGEVDAIAAALVSRWPNLG